jgi:4-amino-4-deoxy-L-arabinose transferase-like glycosyltransferase
LAGYRFWNRPTYGAAALLGFVIALAALTRAEALLLLGFMVVPLAWGLRRRGVTLRRQVILVVVSGVVGLATISPWLVYNLARFEEPVFMTSGTGAVLLAGSCDPAFYGEFMGYYGANCYDEYIRSGAVLGDPRLPRCDQSAVDAAQTDPLDRSREQLDQVARCYPDPLTMDESQRDKISRDLAVKYIEGHRRQLPVVMAARVGRAWDAYVPLQNTRLDVDVEGRGRVASWAGLWFYYAELPFAIYGAVLLWRRRIPLSPLLSMAGVITVTAAITFGVTRYRVPVDVMIAVLAAVGIDALLRLIRPRSTEEDSDMTRREPKDGPGQTVAATGARTTTTTSTAEASSATAGAVMSGAGERGGE